MKTSRDDKLLNRVRAALTQLPDVEEKKMFGGTAFMIRGKMCITARAERIMCRIDPALHDTALEQEGCETVVMKGRPYRGYVFVDAASLNADASLAHWIALALSYNEVISAAKKSRR